MLINNSTMDIIFDESIFTNGLLFNSFDIIGCTNRADRYLIEYNLNKTATNECINAQIVINPEISCGKIINVYTLDMLNKKLNSVLDPAEIIVLSTDASDYKTKQIYLEEFEKDVVYDVNYNLTPTEQAIMIKYYALNNQDFIAITYSLYTLIKSCFKDHRKWFTIQNPSNIIILNEYGELINSQTQELIFNLPNFTSDAININ